MRSNIRTYLAALAAVGLLDALWLGVIATDWYRAGIGHLMAPSPNVPAAAAFYFLYPVGLVVFAVRPSGGVVARAAGLGALLGFFCYGTYDATSLAVLRDWPLWISLMDVAWGAAVSAAGAAAGAWAMRFASR